MIALPTSKLLLLVAACVSAGVFAAPIPSTGFLGRRGMSEGRLARRHEPGHPHHHSHDPNHPHHHHHTAPVDNAGPTDGAPTDGGNSRRSLDYLVRRHEPGHPHHHSHDPNHPHHHHHSAPPTDSQGPTDGAPTDGGNSRRSLDYYLVRRHEPGHPHHHSHDPNHPHHHHHTAPVDNAGPPADAGAPTDGGNSRRSFDYYLERRHEPGHPHHHSHDPNHPHHHHHSSPPVDSQGPTDGAPTDGGNSRRSLDYLVRRHEPGHPHHHSHDPNHPHHHHHSAPVDNAGPTDAGAQPDGGNSRRSFLERRHEPGHPHHHSHDPNHPHHHHHSAPPTDSAGPTDTGAPADGGNSRRGFYDEDFELLVRELADDLYDDLD